MPFANNVYSVPPGTAATTLTAIDSSDYNAFWADVEAAINSLTDGSVSWRAGFPAYAGSAALPGLTFNNDLNSGFYRIGADNIGLSLGGVKAADFGMTGVSLLLKGAPTAGGTANALTVTWGVVPSALSSGQRILFKAASANTGAATLNLNSLGAKAIRKISGGTDAALAAGDIAAGNFYEAVYDSAANSAAGAWVLITPNGSSLASTTQTLTGTNTDSAVTPNALAALWEAGADNTGGATITMGEGGYFNLITSTTAITAFAFTTDKAGRTAIIRFDTARTLTHNATSLILPGGASITTAQGDRCQVRSLGSGNFIVDWYTKADGTAVVSSSSGQPVPTSSTLEVGTFAYLSLTGTPGNLTNGSTVSGSVLYTPNAAVTTGVISQVGAKTGTWKNVSGGTINNNTTGLFVRTA